MDEFIIKMKKNKNCDKPGKINLEFISIITCTLPLIIADTFIQEVCYDTSLWEVIKKIIILSAIVLVVVIKVRKYIIAKNNHISLEHNKKLIQATFDVKEFRSYIHMSSYHLCSYHMVGYYTEDNRTYRFDCEIYDKQTQVCDIFTYIHKKGIFPEKINVYVDSTNYNNYQMQVYEFLDATLKMNGQLVKDAPNNIKFGVDISQQKRRKS